MLSLPGSKHERVRVLRKFDPAGTAEPETNSTACAPVQDIEFMGTAPSHLLICSCEKTMPLDAAAIGRGCAGKITQVNQLCGLDLDRFKEALADGTPITVACTQEAPLF